MCYRITTSRGLCGRVWPPHNTERRGGGGGCHRAAPETTPLWRLFLINLSLSLSLSHQVAHVSACNTAMLLQRQGCNTAMLFQRYILRSVSRLSVLLLPPPPPPPKLSSSSSSSSSSSWVARSRSGSCSFTASIIAGHRNWQIETAVSVFVFQAWGFSVFVFQAWGFFFLSVSLFFKFA